MLYPSAVNDNGSDRRRPTRPFTLERPVRSSECLEGEIGRLQAKADRARLDALAVILAGGAGGQPGGGMGASGDLGTRRVC
jgi:hypothetical protein